MERYATRNVIWQICAARGCRDGGQLQHTRRRPALRIPAAVEYQPGSEGYCGLTGGHHHYANWNTSTEATVADTASSPCANRAMR